MPTSMTFDEHLAAIRASAASLIADAAGLSMADLVPTCPGWTVRDLLAHHGGVCRWAATIVREGRTRNLSSEEMAAVTAAPAGRREIVDWHRGAADELLGALRNATTDPGLVFLQDAPSPLLFWARWSAHETTIHRIDMLAATLGHLPVAANTGVAVELALDGIDELLMGFLPRRSSNLHADEPIVVTVAPTDAARAWTIRIGPGAPVSAPGAAAEPDATLTGSAAALYLGLWNRGDEIAEHGEAPVLGLWREKVRVKWS